MTEAFPLQWPVGRPRTRSAMRSRFEIGMANATRHLLDEIRRMGGNGPVISTNVRLRQDGLPLAELNAARDAMRGAA